MTNKLNWQTVALITIALTLCAIAGATLGAAQNIYRIAESMKPCATSSGEK